MRRRTLPIKHIYIYIYIYIYIITYGGLCLDLCGARSIIIINIYNTFVCGACMWPTVFLSKCDLSTIGICRNDFSRPPAIGAHMHEVIKRAEIDTKAFYFCRTAMHPYKYLILLLLCFRKSGWLEAIPYSYVAAMRLVTLYNMHPMPYYIIMFRLKRELADCTRRNENLRLN